MENSDHTSLEIILDRLNQIDSKIDTYQKDLVELKYNVRSDIEKINLKLDTHGIQIKNIEDKLNKPWKDRIIEMGSSGAIYAFGSIIGISVFSLFVSSLGGNVINIIKTVISSIAL